MVHFLSVLAGDSVAVGVGGEEGMEGVWLSLECLTTGKYIRIAY